MSSTAFQDDPSAFSSYRSSTALGNWVPTSNGRYDGSAIVLRGVTAALVAMGAASGVAVNSSVPLNPALTSVSRPLIAWAPLAAHFEATYEEMESIRSLMDGWDGADSKAPPTDLIDDAQYFLSLLPATVPSPDALVTADGEVGWHWNSDNARVTVMFIGDSRIAFYGTAGGEDVVQDVAPFYRTFLPADLLTAIQLV